MSSSPSVSVIIAAHNHAHFLPECLGSVKAQTYQDYEVIVVDNGSTDNTRKVVKDLSWDKLRYHYQEDTGSVAGPRNTGIKLARGKYVAFLDSDDMWYPEKLQKCMEMFDTHPVIDIISHDLRILKDGTENGVLKVGPLKDDMFELLLTGNRLLGSATVAKKSVMEEVGGFDGSRAYVHAEDYETWLKIAYLKKRFSFISKVLGGYRIHSSNLSHDFKTAFDNELNVLNKHLKNYRSVVPFRKYYIYGMSIGRVNCRLAFKYFENNDSINGTVFLFRSFIINPMTFIRFALGQAKNTFIKGIKAFKE